MILFLMNYSISTCIYYGWMIYTVFTDKSEVSYPGFWPDPTNTII
jgi:hypothetical protein